MVIEENSKAACCSSGLERAQCSEQTVEAEATGQDGTKASRRLCVGRGAYTCGEQALQAICRHTDDKAVIGTLGSCLKTKRR